MNAGVANTVVAAQPVHPGVRVTRSQGGLRVEFDAVGVARGAHGLERRAQRVGLCTLLFTAAVVPVAVLQLTRADQSFVKSGGIVILALVLAAMWAMVAALVLYTIELATRRTTVGVVGGALLVERRSRLATRRTTVAAGEIVALVVEPVYAPLHRRPLGCLIVRRRGGHPLTLLVERRREELVWLAEMLEAALGRRVERT